MKRLVCVSNVGIYIDALRGKPLLEAVLKKEKRKKKITNQFDMFWVRPLILLYLQEITSEIMTVFGIEADRTPTRAESKTNLWYKMEYYCLLLRKPSQG